MPRRPRRPAPSACSSRTRRRHARDERPTAAPTGDYRRRRGWCPVADTTSYDLQTRIAQLEAENARLRETADLGVAGVAPPATSARPPRRGRGRTAGAIVLVLIGLLLAPVAVVSAWARLQLVDGDRFVATFAPLAEDPAVQAFLSDEVTTAI